MSHLTVFIKLKYAEQKFVAGLHRNPLAAVTTVAAAEAEAAPYVASQVNCTAMKQCQGIVMIQNPGLKFLKPKLRKVKKDELSTLEPPKQLKLRLHLENGPQKTQTQVGKGAAPFFDVRWKETMSASVSSLDTQLLFKAVPEVMFGKANAIWSASIDLSTVTGLADGQPHDVEVQGVQALPTADAENILWDELGHTATSLFATLRFFDLS
eukprot:TRINITY_DN13791_c0_g1_i2.p1 TRINITY_DN13791_c0_g1~~TRINITY_DN13791_c0_g1_i2.p1  ORF type:complete len:210 (-),score=43.25 TRINITY_DN13791_c0_g1_i2:59-688(-)